MLKLSFSPLSFCEVLSQSVDRHWSCCVAVLSIFFSCADSVLTLLTSCIHCFRALLVRPSAHTLPHVGPWHMGSDSSYSNCICSQLPLSKSAWKGFKLAIVFPSIGESTAELVKILKKTVAKQPPSLVSTNTFSPDCFRHKRWILNPITERNWGRAKKAVSCVCHNNFTSAILLEQSVAHFENSVSCQPRAGI